MGYAAEIDDDGLYAVAFALNLGLQLLHLVAVKGIGDILGFVSASKPICSIQNSIPDEY